MALPGGRFTGNSQWQKFYESRGADIPREVLRSDCDIGFCGSDVFEEGRLSGEYRPLGFRALISAGCELVLAGREDLDIDEPLNIATSYPLTAIANCQAWGYQIGKVCEFGGRIEGKLAGGRYNAVFD